MGLLELEIRCQKGLFLLWALEENCIYSSVPASNGCLCTSPYGLIPPSSKPATGDELSSCCHFLVPSRLPPSSLIRDTCDHIGPTQIVQINLPPQGQLITTLICFCHAISHIHEYRKLGHGHLWGSLHIYLGFTSGALFLFPGMPLLLQDVFQQPPGMHLSIFTSSRTQ